MLRADDGGLMATEDEMSAALAAAESYADWCFAQADAMIAERLTRIDDDEALPDKERERRHAILSDIERRCDVYGAADGVRLLREQIARVREMSGCEHE